MPRSTPTRRMCFALNIPSLVDMSGATTGALAVAAVSLELSSLVDIVDMAGIFVATLVAAVVSWRVCGCGCSAKGVASDAAFASCCGGRPKKTSVGRDVMGALPTDERTFHSSLFEVGFQP